VTKPSLSPATVSTALGDRFGRPRLTPLVEGEESQAFRFDHEGAGYVVRVGGRELGFRKDAWAAERLGDRIPIPRVVAIQAIDDGHFLCVSERLPGRIIQDVTDVDELEALARPVGEVLAEISAVDMSEFGGAGDFDPATGWTSHDDWPSLQTEQAEVDLDPYRDVLDPVKVARLRDELRDLLGRLPSTRRLIHGDFGGNNLLVDGGRVTGVLDWEAAMIGDPLFDVAAMRFWAPYLPCMRVQADYAEARLAAEPGAAERLRCYLLSSALRAASYYAMADRPAEAAAMLLRLDAS
jgi:hygromycin-B 4-O-kinase